jgi:hypothetical protein
MAGGSGGAGGPGFVEFRICGWPVLRCWKGGGFIALLGVRDDVEQVVQISVDLEVEAPAHIHAALPNIARLIVLLGSQRWMAEVLRQKPQLFIALFLNTQRGIRIAPAETLRVVKPHLGRFRFFRAVKRAKQRRRGPERPVHASLADIVKTFRQTFFDEHFRSEDQAIAVQFNLQVISGRESHFIVEFLRNRDLPANSDLNDHRGPAPSGLYFHIIIS